MRRRNLQEEVKPPVILERPKSYDEDEKQFMCEECRTLFKTETGRKIHISRMH